MEITPPPKKKTPAAWSTMEYAMEEIIAEDSLVQVSSKFPREVPVSVESAIDPPGEAMFSFKNYF